MQEHPNAVRVRQMAALADANDPMAFVKAMEEVLADDVVWHEIGRYEPRRGKAAVLGAMAAADFQIRGQMHDVLANDDHTIILANNTASRGSKTLDYRTAEIYHVRDGKVVERWAFSDDTQAIVDFFA
jgi:ketosteroid isomerase-like protein